MPFFQGSSQFNVNGGEMNDIAGDSIKNTTHNNTNNTDSFNTNVASTTSKDNKVSQSMNIGSPNSNNVRGGRRQ